MNARLRMYKYCYSNEGAIYAKDLWGFAKVVVTRAGRLREWSQRELRLYSVKPTSINPVARLTQQ